ncbi:MAG: endonuclease/exonuclease/phosphatase family protein [Bacteroidales bacterium]|jgi:endonuclease/exonuclease/phosphatase family metal-dependent hydrolase|nr:endonuclease/exonuclease/phosphatase family protein [Bacteroidales bacterium]
MKIKIALLLTIIVSGFTVRSQQLPGNNPVLKILTFNIYHGATMKGDFDLTVIAKVIEDADPDLVALQEVDYRTRRARDYDLVTELGRMVRMAPLFGRAMYYDGGEYGEGILSKFTFIESRNIPLPCTPGNEPRAALEIITVIPPGDTIAFIGTHLDHLKDETDRIAQVKRINEVFSANRYPTILAGDLNAEPGSLPITLMETIWSSSYDRTNPSPTFPSDIPRKKIDYVMHFPRERWRVLESRVICDSVASDHCAYLVTLELTR